jgi:hypothetical protein
MVFQVASTNAAAPIPAPAIQQVVRSGSTTTVSVLTTNDASVSYQLCSTNANGLSTAVSNWPSVGASVTGNGQVRTLQDTTTDTVRFYGVRASR